MVRAGDSRAFADLFQRHQTAARRLARELVRTPAEVDDTVAQAFGWVLNMTQHGGGPNDAFRPYVLTVLRRVCLDRRRGRRAEAAKDDRLPDAGQPFDDPAFPGLSESLIVEAFLFLPDRWRAVLWHTVIEQDRPAEVCSVLGLNPNGVAALKYRALEGLRQAYVQMHIARTERLDCKLAAERLGPFVRDGLPRRDANMVTEHLGKCPDCRAVHAELADINAALRSVVAPAFLGAAAESYLSAAGHGAARAELAAGPTASATAERTVAGATVRAGAAGRHAGTTPGLYAGTAAGVGAAAAAGGHGGTGASGHGGAAGGGRGGAAGGGRGGAGAGVLASAAAGEPDETMAGPTGRFGAAHRIRRGERATRWMAAGIALVAIGIAGGAYAISLHGGKSQRPSSDRHHVVSVQHDPVATSSAPAPSHSAHVSTPVVAKSSSPPKTSPTPRPKVSTTPTPTPPSSPSPKPSSPAFKLSASISVGGARHGGASVFFSVTDTGSKGTGQLTASVTLPAGSSLPRSQNWQGWSCKPTSSGARCTHAAISAGQQAQTEFFIQLDGSQACGKAVELTVRSDSVSASAKSQGVQCNSGPGG